MTSPATILPTVNWDAEADFLLPPPDPTQRLDMAPPAVLTPRDRHRLSLHATLTRAGIPPHPDDAKAIDELSTLDDTVALAICRWLSTHAHPTTPLT
ncbi:hypothetical protein ACFQ0X_04125 [Streptomyces rectiviolaceus]|uniref:Uncharacterized protein n=1 Tax=Streptomyces rectiviolaceus TaxID=332591 RepID=A0ABP6M934_9ACTN